MQLPATHTCIPTVPYSPFLPELFACPQGNVHVMPLVLSLQKLEGETTAGWSLVNNIRKSYTFILHATQKQF